MEEDKKEEIKIVKVSIVEDYGTKKYASVMATLLQNPPLVLPK